MLGFWLVIILAVALFATLPSYQYSRAWGYYPSGIIALALMVLIAVMWFGMLAFSWPWSAPPPPP